MEEFSYSKASWFMLASDDGIVPEKVLLLSLLIPTPYLLVRIAIIWEQSGYSRIKYILLTGIGGSSNWRKS